MKKLNFRAILILLLVVVLAFALVACGDKDKDTDKGNNGGDTTNNGGNNNGGNNNGGNGNTDDDDAKNIANVKSYFNTLWNLTSGIGSEEVADNEDLAISLDLGIALETVDSFKKVYQSIDLGIGVEAILDRSSEGSSANTAFKISIHGKDNENWATFYYFFNDPSNIYIDFAGQNIVLPYNYESKDGKVTPDQFKTLFYNFVNKDVLDDKSVMDIVAFFTDDLGADWTLNTLVTGVTKLFNIDNLKGMLFPEDSDNPQNSTMATIGGILGYVGLNEDNMFDKNNNLDLESILTSETIASVLFKGENTTVTEKGAHTEVDLSLLSMVQSYLKEWSEIVNDQLIVELDYGIKDNQIDGFDIGVTFGSISAKVNKKTVMPKVTISINDLSIGKASKDGLKMATDKTNYSKEIAVDAKADCSLCGITIDLSQVNSERVDVLVEKYPSVSTGIKLDGTLEIGVYGKLDIANIINKDQTNTTALKAWVSFDNVNIIEMSMVGDRVAIVVNQEAKIDGVNIADAIISLFGDKVYDMMCKSLGNEGARIAEQLFDDDTHLVINSEFKGVVITGNDVARNFNEIINTVIGMICKKDETGDVATVAAEDSTITKVIKTIRKILPYINTEDGLTIDITNKTIGQVVEEIGKIWDRAIGNQNNIINGIIAKDESSILTIMSQIIKLNGFYYDDAEGLLAELFASNALISLDFGEDGISLDVDVDVNMDCGVDLSISLKATELTEIVDLGKDVNEVGNGWYYCEL